MALFSHLLICALWGFLMNYTLAADSMSISDHHGALLVKNGKQTSCEIALIDNRAGFVAATCVVDGSGNLDTNSRYEIYIDDGDNEKPKNAPIVSSSIRVHPQFKMSNFANNIAIVQFSVDVKDSWSIKVAVDHGSWSSSLYVRRYMANKNAMRWAKPKTSRSSLTRPECAASSGLYASNYFDFRCSSDTAGTMVGSQCGVPYGTVYGQVNDRLAIGGIYSHSVAEGDSICSSGRVVHYYLYLSNYLAFAQNVLGRGVLTLSTGNFAVNSDAWYAMEPESFATPSGTRILGGNAFNRASGETMVTATGAAQPEANQQNNNDSDNQDPPNNDQPDNNDSTNNGGQVASSAAQNPQPTSNAPSNNQATTTTTTTPNNSSPTSNSNAQASTTTNASEQSNDNTSSDASPSSKDDTSEGQLASGSSDHKINNGDSLNEGNKEVADSSNDLSANSADSSDSSELEASATKGSKKLSGGQVAGIVIGVLLFCILAAVGGFYGMRWYRELRIKKWSPDAVRQILESHIVDNETGNSPSTKFELPSYRNHRGTMFVDAGPNSHD
ncbi:hypothetical protein BX667DRAFT_501985 [Coemansia mojavensis]|nr:hypothetical protein BX667DRAFT_501985 [Coemansia mojavensis]